MTQKVFNIGSNLQSVHSGVMCTVLGSMYQLPPNKPYNDRLAALFPKVTHAEIFRRELLGSIEKKLIVFDFTVGKLHSLPLKVQSGSLHVQWVWHICQFQRFGKRY